MGQEYSRTRRVADQLQRELATLIQFEVKDPRVGMVTISAVEVSRDLGYARVFVTVLDDQEPIPLDESIKALNNAASFMRSQLARRMSLRTVPNLFFCYDESLKRGNYLSNLIDQARATDAD
jgi:ribosome-binding factor A